MLNTSETDRFPILSVIHQISVGVFGLLVEASVFKQCRNYFKYESRLIPLLGYNFILNLTHPSARGKLSAPVEKKRMQLLTFRLSLLTWRKKKEGKKSTPDGGGRIIHREWKMASSLLLFHIRRYLCWEGRSFRAAIDRVITFIRFLFSSLFLFFFFLVRLLGMDLSLGALPSLVRYTSLSEMFPVRNVLCRVSFCSGGQSIPIIFFFVDSNHWGFIFVLEKLQLRGRACN